MARNGSGVYVLPPSNPVASGTVIESTWANDTMSDIANALTQSIAVDGQTVPTANLQMGGFHHTNVSDPNLRSQYATLGMVQDGRHTRVQITGGVDNLIGTLIGGATAYVAGSLVTFFAPATNTGSMTLNYNGIGARSLTDPNGLPLAAGEISSGEFVLALYTGTEFRLLTSVDTAVAADLYNLSITGQVRPPSTLYPALTIATGTTINIPAGSAWIVPPGNDTDDAKQVSWNAQTITLQFLASSFTTFIMVDNTGTIQQVAGRAVGANFRGMALLGVVEHIGGVANQVITRPAIFGDDGYRARDQASLLANTIINGGLVQPNSVSGLQLDVAQGTIFIPGGTANTVDSPNTYNIPPQANISFRPLAGQNTLSALTATVPVGSYDANGAGVVAALPNPGDATVHRLFYLYGQYILAYGQQVYTSIENALSMLAWDRTKFKKSLYLADATLMAEVIAIRSATNLNLIAQGAVVCPGGLNFSIGSPGGIAEAPIDGFPYGRRNAAWFQVLGSVSPMITTDATITGAAPKLKEVVSPYGAGTSGFEVYAAANKWFTVEVVNPDDKVYFRSYNPGSGALRFTTTYDLATGAWTFPGTINSFTLANACAATLTTSAMDTTVGRVTRTGDAGWLLISNNAILVNLDTTATIPSGSFRYANGVTLGTPPTGAGANATVLVERYSPTIVKETWTDIVGGSAVPPRTWVRSSSALDTWGPWYEVLKQGDHGLGSVDTAFIADANGLTNTGIFAANNTTLNTPNTTLAWMILHMNLSSTAATQIAFRAQNNTNPDIYMRVKASGAYGAWFKVNDETAKAAYAFGSGYSSANGAGYRRKAGIVYLEGAISRSSPIATGQTVVTLPVGFRPQTQMGVTCLIQYANLSTQIVNFQIGTDGVVETSYVITVAGTVSGNCSFWMNLSFPAA